MPEQQEDKRIGDFAEIVQEVARELSKTEGKVTGANGIPSLLGRCGVEGEVNCYPGQPNGNCYPLAFFVSLHSREITTRQSIEDGVHLSFRKMLEIMVRHMTEEPCKDKTLFAVIITDSWDARAWEKWSGEVAAIKKQEHKSLEAYLIVEGEVVSIPV